MKHAGLPQKLPRVHDLNSRANKIPSVPGGDHQVALDRSCRQQAVHIRQSFMRIQTSPDFSHIEVDSQNPPFKNRYKLGERSFKYNGFRGISCPDLLHAPSYFSHRQYTQIMLLCGVVKEPCTHTAGSARAPLRSSQITLVSMRNMERRFNHRTKLGPCAATLRSADHSGRTANRLHRRFRLFRQSPTGF